MSNFPYNHHKYDGPEHEVNGTSHDYQAACKLADDILMWHSEKDTDDWTQSNDGHDWDVRNLAFGLMELFSDPGAVRRIMLTGEAVESKIKTLLHVSDLPHASENTKKEAEVISRLFE